MIDNNRFTGVGRFFGAGPRQTTPPLSSTHSASGHTAPVIRGGTRGLKKFVATATGKSYAGQDPMKNLALFKQAVKAGKTAFIDTHGNVHDITTISKQQEFLAKHLDPNTGDIKTKAGIQKYTRGFVRTAREIGVKLREGENIGTEYEAAKKLAADLEPDTSKELAKQAAEEKKADALEQRRARLETLHASIRPPAPVAGIKPNAPLPSMTFGAITPLSSGAPRYSTPLGGRTPANITSSGGSGRYSPSTVEPTPIAPPTGTSTEDGSASLTPSTPRPEPTAPAEPILQNPEPLNDPGEPQPPHPAIPADTGPMGDIVGESGDE